MFTGIVTDMGEVRSVKPRADNLHRITIFCRYPRAELVQGASIACSGVCLTVVDTGEEDGRAWFAVEAAASTWSARSSWATSCSTKETGNMSAIDLAATRTGSPTANTH